MEKLNFYGKMVQKDGPCVLFFCFVFVLKKGSILEKLYFKEIPQETWYLHGIYLVSKELS